MFALLGHTAKEGAAGTVTTNPLDTTGATLLVAVCSTSGLTTFTDNQSNVWMRAQSTAISSFQHTDMFVCVNPITNASHTFTMTGGFPSICVLAFSGAPGAVETYATATSSSSTSLGTGSITPAQANTLLVTGMCGPQVRGLSIDGGFTISDQVGGNTGQLSGAAYLIQTTVAAAAPTWTLSGSDTCSAMMMAIQLSGGGGGGGEVAFVFG
jgi:hypothetical protein